MTVINILKRLSILLLKTYIGPFIVTFMVAMFIFEMQFIWVYLDELVGKGLSSWVIFKLLFFASSRVVNMALPLAILMSSIMAMGALAENNELTAMKGAGVSLFRIMRPLIFFSIGLSTLAFVFANNIWPVANLKTRTILFNIMKQKPSLNLTEGVFYQGIEGVSIRAGGNNQDTGELTDVLIYDHRGTDRENRTVIRAKRGVMEQTADKTFMIMTLHDGHSYDEQKDEKKKNPSYHSLSSSFEQSTLRIDLSSLSFTADNEELMKNPAEMMTIPQLVVAVDSLKKTYDTLSYRLFESNIRFLHLESVNKEQGTDTTHLGIFASMEDRGKLKALATAKENSRKSKESVSRLADELKGRQKFINRHKIEFHRKFFLAAVCLVLFFIGAPLGAIIKKGGIGVPTLIALAFFIVYQLLTMAGERMAKNQLVEPWFGMWMSTFLLLPLSIWITYKATKEAQLVDKEIYLRGLQKVLEFLRLRKKKNSVV